MEIGAWMGVVVRYLARYRAAIIVTFPTKE